MPKNSFEFHIHKNNIDEIIKEKNAAVRKAMIECGADMERYATEACPVKTGRLKNSITFATVNFHSKGGGSPATAEDKALRGKPEEGAVYVGTNVEYAPYVELGSSKRRKKPFLKPAVQDHLSSYKEIINRVLKEG